MSSKYFTPKLLIAAMVVLIYWPAGFFPVTPLVERVNHARQFDNGDLHFPAPGIAVRAAVPQWLAPAVTSGELTLRLKIRTADLEQDKARIFILAKDNHRRSLVLEQHRNRLVIQIRKSPARRGYLHRIYLPRVFVNKDWLNIQLILSGPDISVQVNGNMLKQQTLPVAPVTTWPTDYVYSFGNSLGFDRPWLGQIATAQVQTAERVYDLKARALLQIRNPYRFERFDRVERFWNFAVGQATHDRNAVRDWLVNFFGFFPLGGLAVFAASGGFLRRLGWAAAISFGVSLSIEVTQFALPWRVPAIEDLLLNTVGGLSGALIGLALAVWRRPGTLR